MEKRHSLAVIIPMFNEEAGAEVCVRTVCDELKRLPVISKLIVIDDGSTDSTLQILNSCATKEATLVVESHNRNRGYGAALRTGVKQSAELGMDYSLFMDSDLTNSPSDIAVFLPMIAAGFDVIKATRYSRGGGVSGVPLYRFLISYLGNKIAKHLFRLPLNDSTNGFRAVKTGILLQMNLREQRFSVIMEELYWCKYLAVRFAEIPVTLTNRDEILRSSSFTYTPGVFWSYLKYPVRAFFGLRPPGLVMTREFD